MGQLTIGVMLTMLTGLRRRAEPVWHLRDQEVQQARHASGAQTIAGMSWHPGRTGPHSSSQLAEPMHTRRDKRVKSRRLRRNPVARTLRDPAFRARREANRRRYSRKPKHKQDGEGDDA